MRHSILTGALAAFALTSLAASGAASAACTRLAFSVNDYGKDGPSKDAQILLDKYVAKWAGEHGIKKYTTGKKSVSCELFLNFVLFDEHTCKAEASVCWDGPPVAAPQSAAVESTDGAPKKAKAATTTTGSIEKPAAGKTEGAAATKDDSAAKSDAAKSASAKPKTVTAAKPAAEPPKPKAPLPEKPESAPVQ